MNYIKEMKVLVTLLVISCALMPLNAQETFEEFKKKDVQRMADFIAKDRAAFRKFLENDWISLPTEVATKKDTQPKPEVIPQAPIEIPMDDEEPVDEPITSLPDPEPIVDNSIAESIEVPPASTLKYFNTPYFGLELPFSGEKISIPAISTPSRPAVLSFWDSITSSHAGDILTQLQMYKSKLNLNDWAYFKLAYELGTSMSSAKNDAILITWYCLLNSGYDVRIGFDKENIYLLSSSKTVIYNVPMAKYEGFPFYVIPISNETIQLERLTTYEGAYEGQSKALDLQIRQTPHLDSVIKSKRVAFEWKGENHSIDVSFDQRWVDFLHTVPSTEMGVYFDAPISYQLQISLRTGFEPLLVGKSKSEAVNMLLRFVQTAFKYKTDGDQFGVEKYFFAEEIFSYPYSDCEDRSVLFAYMVEDLLNLDVVGVNFPGHTATAVQMPTESKGDYVVIGNQKYIICDPTYVNAIAGMLNPDVSINEAKIVRRN